MKRALVAVLLLAALAIAHLPTASAENTATNIAISLTPSSEPIKPLSEFRIISGTIRYSYVEVAAPSAITPTKITLSAQGPPWATVTISPSTTFLMPSPNEAEVSDEFSLIVTALADAPAFQPGNIVVTASAAGNGQLAPSTASEQVLVAAEYFSLLDAQVAQPIRKVGQQKTIDFPVTVSNFGNAQTKISFEVLETTGGLSVPTPAQMSLDSRVAGGKQTSNTAFVSVQTPHQNGFMNEPGLVRIAIKGAYSLDPSKKGDEITLSLLVNTFGFYAPGPAPILGVLGAVGMALVARPLVARIVPRP